MNAAAAQALQIQLGPARAVLLGRNALQDIAELATTDRKSIERRRCAAALDLAEAFSLDQVHGAACVEIAPGRPEYLPEGDVARADALYTARRGVALLVRVADCLPLLFCLSSGADQPALIGVVHAGWRGMAEGIIAGALRSAIRAFERRSDSPWQMHCAIGPHICATHYEVGPEVAERFRHTRPGSQDRSFLDLAAEARSQAEEACRDPHWHGGLNACTTEQNNLYFSHRCGDVGRNLLAIALPSAGGPSNSE
ncbi:MAG: polyphenol oxidase family protein [Leptospirales bacterium]|nr:polyphenol oxidase family protein [Leptospirales bacterium]